MTHERPSRTYHVVKDTEPPPYDENGDDLPTGQNPPRTNGNGQPARRPSSGNHPTAQMIPPAKLRPSSGNHPVAAPLGYRPAAAPYPLTTAVPPQQAYPLRTAAPADAYPPPSAYVSQMPPPQAYPAPPAAAPYPLYNTSAAAPAMAYPAPEVHVHMQAAPQPVAAPAPLHDEVHNPPRPLKYAHMGSHIVEHVKAHVAQVIIAIILTIGVPVVIHIWQMHKLGPPKPMFPNLPAPSLTGHTNLHSDTEPTPVLTARERGEGLPSAAGAAPVSQVITNPTDAVANAIISAATGSSSDTTAASSNLAEATFAGNGRYEIYRQGALTWRFDTTTGHACILYASDTLWYNASVSAHGCTGDE